MLFRFVLIISLAITPSLAFGQRPYRPNVEGMWIKVAHSGSKVSDGAGMFLDKERGYRWVRNTKGCIVLGKRTVAQYKTDCFDAGDGHGSWAVSKRQGEWWFCSGDTGDMCGRMELFREGGREHLQVEYESVGLWEYVRVF